MSSKEAVGSSTSKLPTAAHQMLLAAVRIQVAWKGRLLLIRERQRRAAEMADALAEEKRLFAVMMARRHRGRSSRPRRGVVDDGNPPPRSTANTNRTAPMAAPPTTLTFGAHAPRYAKADNSPVSQPVTPPTSPAIASSIRPKTQSGAQPAQTQVAAVVAAPSASAAAGRAGGALPSRSPKPPLTVDGAANVIKFFIVARRMLHRQREQRNKERDAFLKWESSTFEALVPSRVPSLAKLKSGVRTTGLHPETQSAQEANANKRAVRDPAPQQQPPPCRGSQEMTLDDVATAAAAATATSSLRNVEHQEAEAIGADPTRTVPGGPAHRWLAPAPDLPEPIVPPQPLDSPSRNDANCDPVAPRRQHDITTAVLRAAIADLEDDEECCRFECATRYTAKTSILVAAFFEVARSLLASTEAQRRGSVVKAERTAFGVLEDVARMSDDWMHSRVRSVVVLQCWARSIQARRTRSIKSKRRDQRLLQRFTEERVSQLDAQDMGTSVHLTRMVRAVAATTVQRVVRGHLGRLMFQQVLHVALVEDAHRQHTERVKDDAAMMIYRFLRRCCTRRVLRLRQRLLACALQHGEWCDASEALLSSVATEAIQRQHLVHDEAVGWDEHVVELQRRAATSPPPPGVLPPPVRIDADGVVQRPLKPKRPESARMLPSARVQQALRRPTTATSSRKKNNAAMHGGDEAGMLPYTDGSHDSNAALRALTSTPLFVNDGVHNDGLTTTNPRPQQQGGVSVSHGDQKGRDGGIVSPTANDMMITDLDDVDSQGEDDGVDHQLTGSPMRRHPRTNNDGSSNGDALLNYVGMLEVFKKTVLSTNVLSHRQRSRTPQAAAAAGDVGILYRDLVDVCLCRRGAAVAVQAPPVAVTITITGSNSVGAVGEGIVDAPLIVSPTNSMHHLPHGLAALWFSDKFMDRVVERLGVLVLPHDIAHHVFCLDEVAVAVLSSIEVVRCSEGEVEQEDGGGGGCNGRADPALRLYQGQPVADRSEFESFAYFFSEALRQLTDERRAVDAACIATCFSLLDVHRRRLVPRTLFNEVFPLRLPSPPMPGSDDFMTPSPLRQHQPTLQQQTQSSQQDVSFLTFAALLRRNLIHSPLTCQKHMGVFLQRVTQRIRNDDGAVDCRKRAQAEGGASDRLLTVQRTEGRLRGLAVELLEALESVGERAGVSLGDALVLYTSLMAAPAARIVQWFCLSFLTLFYNTMHLKAMGCFAGLAELLAKLKGVDDGDEVVAVHGSAPPPPTSPVWSDVLRMVARLLESPAFVDALRLQRLCDGTAARSNPYRVPVSDTEEVDRCVPWSAFELPCLDSLNYYASQRVTFDAELDLKIKTDPSGFLYIESGSTLQGHDKALGTTRRRITDLGVDLTGSASTHLEGFGLRRRQLNNLFYALRHYSLCLCDVAELQCMAQSHGLAGGTLESMRPKRARTMLEAEQQLVRYLDVHPDLLPTFPFRVATDASAGGGHPKLFTSRFSRMLFTLSVIDPALVDVPPPLPPAPGGRRPSAPSPLGAAALNSDDLHGNASPPLCDRMDPLRGAPSTAERRTTAAGSPMVPSRPSSASSIGSSASRRLGPSDLCSPPSRAMPSKPLSSVLFAEPASAAGRPTALFSKTGGLASHSAVTAAGIATSSAPTPQPGARSQQEQQVASPDGQKKSVVMESIMSSFRGILRVDAQPQPTASGRAGFFATRPASATVKPTPPPANANSSSSATTSSCRWGNGGGGVYAAFRSGGLLDQQRSTSGGGGGNAKVSSATTARRPNSAR